VKQHKFVSAVIRCRNAESRIAYFVTSVDAALDATFDAFEIVIVDDASTDSSSQIIKDLAGRLHGAVSVIEMAYFHGIEAAMVAGLDRAMGDFVFEFEDTYLDFPIDVLSRMYETAVGGFDIVAAVPSKLPRRTRAFYSWCNRFSSFEPPLAYERLRVSSRRAIDAMLQQRERVRYRQVLYRLTGYRYARLEYVPDPQWARSGENDLRFALDVIFSVTESGVRLARLFVVIFAVIAVVGVVSTIVLSIVRQAPAWELILAVIVAAGFCGVFVIQAVIGEYAARILAEVRSRPLYTIDKTRTWTRTPTETAWAPTPVPAEDRVLALGDPEPFMLRQRREAEEDRLMAERGSAMSRVEPPASP
jgi:polyisoprenyl-phosphate glycosyltransferase